MKSLISISLLAFFAAQAHAYTDVRVVSYCTVGNPFVMGVSNLDFAEVRSDDTVRGALDGVHFSFKNKGKYSQRTGLTTYKSGNVTVQIQNAGMYDGVQDTLWGKIKIGRKSKTVNCYITGN